MAVRNLYNGKRAHHAKGQEMLLPMTFMIMVVIRVIISRDTLNLALYTAPEWENRYAQTGSKADDNRTELRHRGGEKLHKRYPPAGTFPRPSRIRETLVVQLCEAAAKAGASQA